MRAFTLKVAVIGFVLTSIFGIGFYIVWQSFLRSPIFTFSEPRVYSIESGDSLSGVAFDLDAKGYINSPHKLVLLGRLLGVAKKVQSGEYLLDPSYTPKELLSQLILGQVIQHPFVIVEGWDFHQVMEALNKLDNIQHTIDESNLPSMIAKLEADKQQVEGQFFPETYHYTKNSSDFSLLQRAYHKMQDILFDEWKTRSNKVPYKSAYEALIAASLIEKETFLIDEKAKIAGVIIRRLRSAMPLQIDAAVIYGLGDKYTGKLTKKNLKQDTEYNTYTRRGLPPTPIAMPSSSSIHAALHPDITDALYYVAKGDGSHVFSSSLVQHNKAVKQYRQKKLRKAS